MSHSYQLRPIGRIVAGDEGFAIAVDEPFREALTGLEGFSHVNVLWWCHLLDTPEYRAVNVAEKPYRDGPESTGHLRHPLAGAAESAGTHTGTGPGPRA